MTNDKCPRCGHEESQEWEATTFKGEIRQIMHWNCGTYREPSGNLYESELCETRQELQSLQNGLIAELCPCGRADGYECEAHSFDLLMRVRELKMANKEADRKSEEKYLMMRDSLDLLKDQLAHSKAKAEKAEAELDRLTQENDMLRSDVRGMLDTEQMLEAELAKLEKAIDESYDYCDKVTSLTIFGHSFKEAHEMAAREMPNYADWLKSRQ